jgi:hypothetical protein
MDITNYLYEYTTPVFAVIKVKIIIANLYSN